MYIGVGIIVIDYVFWFGKVIDVYVVYGLFIIVMFGDCCIKGVYCFGCIQYVFVFKQVGDVGFFN